MINSCKICLSNKLHEISTIYDDRYGYAGQFPLLHCRSCGHKLIEFNVSDEAITDLYSNYYPRQTFDLKNYKPYSESSKLKTWFNGELSSAFRWIPENKRVLDIGCGYCESLGYHQNRGCEAFGVEADENVKELAEKFGFNVHIGLFDPQIYQNNYFDYITLDQVLEHMEDPVLILQGIKRILRPGGKVIISTPNANGWGAHFFKRKWVNWHVPYHMHFFSEKSLKRAAEDAGLELDQIKTITSSAWLNYQWKHLATFPKAGTPSTYWSPQKQPSISEQTWLKFITLLHVARINHFLTRFFDLINAGDNYLFILKKP